MAKKISNNQEIANVFNTYFTDIGSALAAKIPDVKTIDYRQFMDEGLNKSMFVQPVTELEIIEIVKKFQNKKSRGYDNVNMIIVKQMLSSIVMPLTHIFNLSLEKGVFPNGMKLAKVIPMHKNGSASDIKNYRPVSLLPIFSKLLEKVFYNRLLNFVDKHKMLSKCQYGFRKKHSTVHALTELTELIADSLEKKEQPLGLFIDLRKAFDTIDHNILFNKLHYYGVRGTALDWIKSYFHERKQFVSIGSTKSMTSDIRCGVPQGSILGPLLFIMYVNDLKNVSVCIEKLLFADDTNLLYSNKCYIKTFEVMNEELKKLTLWFKINKLSLNIEKTSYIHFGKHTKGKQSELYIDKCQVIETNVYKFLGVLVDSHLNWKSHISHVEKKISRGIGILCRLKKVFTNEALLMIYYTTIFPHLDYCCEVWGSTCSTYLTRLTTLQKRAVRIIDGLSYKAHTTKSFQKLGILKLKDMVKLKCCMHTYKAEKELLPDKLQERYKRVSDIHHYQTRQANSLYPPKSLSQIKQRCLSVYGVAQYNDLSDKFKNCKS